MKTITICDFNEKLRDFTQTRQQTYSGFPIKLTIRIVTNQYLLVHKKGFAHLTRAKPFFIS